MPPVADPESGKHLPMWAAEEGDRILIADGWPALNERALAVRSRDGTSSTALGELREIVRALQLAVRSVEMVSDNHWDLGAVLDGITEINQHTNELLRNARLREERALDERRQAIVEVERARVRRAPPGSRPHAVPDEQHQSENSSGGDVDDTVRRR